MITCLVTGNLEPIGWAKMDALGIKHLFKEPYFGGFGSDYCNPDNSEQSWKDRAELVKIAAQKTHKIFPGAPVVHRHPAVLKTMMLLPSRQAHSIRIDARLAACARQAPW